MSNFIPTKNMVFDDRESLRGFIEKLEIDKLQKLNLQRHTRS